MILSLLDRNLLPDFLIRYGIRRLLAERKREIYAGGSASASKRTADLMNRLHSGPLAVETRAANEQHYEVPAEFYLAVLGPCLKYSSCYWPEGVKTLADAEVAMLDLTIQRAGLADGQTVLDLGCGWGSFSLYAAQRFPNTRFVGISNSASQRAFIEGQARARGLNNLVVLTADINQFDPWPALAARRPDWLPEGERAPIFDRIVSIEMMEHVRNHRELFRRLALWTKPDGAMFVHVFAHHEHAYLFEVESTGREAAGDWMSRYFFTGGMMPSFDWLPETARRDAYWTPETSDVVNGQHYQRTLEAWLATMDAKAQEVRPVLALAYGEAAETLWWVRWRVFFMACAELFGWAGGTEWVVGHYRFQRTDQPVA